MFKVYNFLFLISTVVFVVSCKTDVKQTSTKTEPTEMELRSGEALAATIDGRKLNEWQELPEVKTQKEKELAELRMKYLQKQGDVSAYLNYAKSYLSVGRIENAIDILDRAATKFPNTADVFYWRGLSAFTGRHFADVNDDLLKTAQLLESQKNYKGILPLHGVDSILDPTLQYNTYLTLGQNFQATGDFENAGQMYEIIGDFSTNPDLWTLTYYWQYQCYARGSRLKEAQEILAKVDKTKQTLAPFRAYLDAILFWRGDIKESQLVDINKKPSNAEEAKDWLIKSYAVIVKHMLNNDEAMAAKVCKIIDEAGYWNQPAAVLAEADAARLKNISIPTTQKINLSGSRKQE